MHECKKCKGNIPIGSLMFCPNCGAEMCGGCANQTFSICPYCYFDLELKG